MASPQLRDLDRAEGNSFLFHRHGQFRCCPGSAATNRRKISQREGGFARIPMRLGNGTLCRFDHQYSFVIEVNEACISGAIGRMSHDANDFTETTTSI
jgi:hypothetical protein